MEETYHAKIIRISNDMTAERAKINNDKTLSIEERYKRNNDALDRFRNLLNDEFTDEIERIKAGTNMQRDQIYAAMERVLVEKQEALCANLAEIGKVTQEKIDALCMSSAKRLWYHRRGVPSDERHQSGDIILKLPDPSTTWTMLSGTNIRLIFVQDTFHMSYCYASLDGVTPCEMPNGVSVIETAGIIQTSLSPVYSVMKPSFYRGCQCFHLASQALYIFHYNDVEIFRFRPVVVHEIIPSI